MAPLGFLKAKQGLLARDTVDGPAVASRGPSTLDWLDSWVLHGVASWEEVSH